MRLRAIFMDCLYFIYGCKFYACATCKNYATAEIHLGRTILPITYFFKHGIFVYTMVHSSDFTSTSSLLWFLSFSNTPLKLTVRQQFMKKELQNRFLTKITTPTNFALIHPIFTFGVHNSYIDLLRTFQYNGAVWT